LSTFEQITEEQILEKLIMKIAMRVFVLTVVLAVAGLAQSGFTGPGPRPEPPVAVNF
jgi:hypothetical protein